MMSAIRRLAIGVLRFVVKRSSPEAQSWGSAMVREMDFVENDWSAALWALGSTAALCKYSLTQQLHGLAKKMPAMLTAMVAAGFVPVMGGLLLSRLLHASWFDPAQRKLFDRLLIVVVPEVLYLAGAVALWRRRKAIAAGILTVGALLIAHAVIHFVSHG